MGQYVRWQAIIAFVGIILLAAYLNSITIKKTTIIVPAEGGTYREGVVGTLQYINPLLAEYNPVDQDISSLIFEGLTQDDGLGNLEPALAQNWSVSADGLVYVFVLRQDIRWSDGALFKADDVLFTLDLIRSPEFPGNPAWQALWQSVEIEQVDDYTIRFTLAEVFPSFIYYTSIGILPKHILKDVPARDLLNLPFNLAPIGTGPFKLEEATDRHVLLTRNTRYRGQPSRIEAIEFKFYPDTLKIYQAFKNQNVDGISQLSPPLLKQLQGERNIQLYSAALPRYDLVYFNLQQAETLPFFQDKLVRKALSMLLDRQTLVNEALGGQAIPTSAPFLPWSWAYNPLQEYPEYDLIQAKAILDEAGWIDSDGDGIRDKEGVAFKFSLLLSNNPTHINVAKYIAQTWRKAGIGITLETQGADLNFGERLATRAFEAVLVEVKFFGDPDPYPFWHQTQIEGGQNFAAWDNTPASMALEQGRLIIEQGERIQHYYAFQEIFADELPALVLYYPVYNYVLRDTVKEAHLSPVITPAARFKNIQDWYLLTQRVIEIKANP